MIRLFGAIAKIRCEDNFLIANNVTFEKDFGPWKKGERCDLIRMNYRTNILEEVDENGHIVRSQEYRIISRSNLLDQIISWLNNDEDPETLITRDGRKVYRFYQGSNIDTFLRSIHAETE
jgi:hypothetical protein